MRKLCYGSLAATVGLMLIGCVQQSPAVGLAAAATELSTGAPLLRCRADCVAEWRRAQPYAAQLDAAARWSELAALVISINYQDDLTLYYLARAAEGLGYRAAAASYYRQSTYISGTSLSCEHESGVCGEVILPDAALARIQALENEARRSRLYSRRYPATGAKPAPLGSKPVAPAEHQPPAAPEREPLHPEAAGPESLQPAAPVSQPAEPALPAAGQNRSTASERPDNRPESLPPTRVDPTAEQYIEPPAAR